MHNLIKSPVLFCLYILCALVHPRVAADQSVDLAIQMLPEVAKALKHANYRGRVTYEQGGKLEVMEVSHGVIDGQEYEKILFLNGDERALAKQGRETSCTKVGETLLNGLVLNQPDGSIAALQRSYHISVVGEDRVAGREAWVLQMLPNDEFRHGVLISIDKQSYLPLKTLYVTSGRKVLERLHFVSLEVPVVFQADDFADYHVLDEQKCSANKSPASYVSDWRPTWIPPGFVLSNATISRETGHIHTYTDGLASFSVFVQPIAFTDGDRGHMSTNMRKGATVILLRRVGTIENPVQISLLGEIPSVVASKILASVNIAVN